MKLVQEIFNVRLPLFRILGEKMFVSTHNEVWEWDKSKSRLLQIFKTDYPTKELFHFLINVEDKFVFIDIDSWFCSNFDNPNVFIFDEKGNFIEQRLSTNRYNNFIFDKKHIGVYDESNVLFRYDIVNDRIISKITENGTVIKAFTNTFLLFKDSDCLELYDNKTDKKLWTTDLNKYLRTNFYGDKEKISHLDIHYHAHTNQILVCTSWGYLISINPETGHINQAKQTLKGVGIIDPYSDMSYPTSTSAFNGTDTRKYDLQLYAQDITNEGEPIFIKEYTPDMFGLKGNRLSTIKNIGYRSTVGCNEHSLFIAFYGQGSIFQIDKKTGDIVDRYKVPKNELEGHPFVFDNHLFVPTKHGGANPYSLLVFDTSMP